MCGPGAPADSPISAPLIHGSSPGRYDLACGSSHHRLKAFGRTTAIYFALWTVAAVPGLLLWATVNFGLHPLSSFWPFVLLYVATRSMEEKPPAVWLGVITGLSISWSYDSLVLVPASLVLLV